MMAAKRFRKLGNVRGIIWKTLVMAERASTGLDASELLAEDVGHFSGGRLKRRCNQADERATR
jgi:hypothetical protein